MKVIIVLIISLFFIASDMVHAESVRERIRRARENQTVDNGDVQKKKSSDARSVRSKQRSKDERREKQRQYIEKRKTMKNGALPMYDEAGRKVKEEVFRNGQKVEELTFDHLGNVRSRAFYKNGVSVNEEFYDIHGNITYTEDYTEMNKKMKAHRKRQKEEQRMEDEKIRRELREKGISEEEYIKQKKAQMIRELELNNPFEEISK